MIDVPSASLDAIVRRMHALGALREQPDSLSLHDLDQVDFDIAALSPADRYPGVRGDEVIDRSLGNNGQAVLPPQLGQQFVGHQRPAETRSNNNDFRHTRLRLLRSLKCGRAS